MLIIPLLLNSSLKILADFPAKIILNTGQRPSYKLWVGTSCMGAYYVLNTYYVLYFTYNTLHTYRAKQD